MIKFLDIQKINAQYADERKREGRRLVYRVTR
jgi:hypothetical protein